MNYVSDYFENTDWLSNSALKDIKGTFFPDNIAEIFRFGDLAHRALLEGVGRLINRGFTLQSSEKN